MKKENGYICLGQKHELKSGIRQRVMKTEKNTKIAQVKYLMGIPAVLAFCHKNDVKTSLQGFLSVCLYQHYPESKRIHHVPIIICQ